MKHTPTPLQRTLDEQRGLPDLEHCIRTSHLRHRPWAATQIQLIRQSIQQCGGNMCAAARQLGISRPTLYRKLRKAGGQ